MTIEPPNSPGPTQGGQSAAPLCVTLIHGTWGSRSAWSASGSRMWDELTAAGAECHQFVWSGHNSHRARRRGADELERILSERSAATPGVRHALVAHSHGGNVALHAAARLTSSGMGPVRVVTLATPYLFAVPTRTGIRWHTLTLVVASLYALAIVTAWFFLPDTPFGSPATLPLAVLTGLVVALQVASWVHFRLSHGRLGSVSTTAGVVDSIQAPEVADDGPVKRDDLLIIRAADDEAGGLLGSAQFAGWLGFTAARLTRPDRWFVLLSVVVFLLPNLTLVVGDSSGLPRAVGVVLDWSFSVFFALALLISVPAVASMAYGLDGPAVSRIAVVTAEASPPGHSTVWQRPIRPSRATGLAHSSLYDDQAVVTRVLEHFIGDTPRSGSR